MPGSYDAALAGYQAWYPDHGGNLRVEAGRDIVGDVWTGRAESGTSERDWALYSSAAVGNWLWRQGTGSTTGVEPVPTSWWVNFGAYTNVSAAAGASPRMVGFTGFGTLGGGNLTLEAGRDAGVRDAIGDALDSTIAPRSGAIIAAVGSTGRVSDGQLHLTGGGDLQLRIGGALNPNLRATFSSLNASRAGQNLDLNGTFSNLRGSLQLDAGRIGAMGVTLKATRRWVSSARQTCLRPTPPARWAGRCWCWATLPRSCRPGRCGARRRRRCRPGSAGQL